MQGGFNMSESTYRCAIERRCGGCQWLDVPYHDQLARKQQTIKELFTPYLKRGAMLDPIIGMDTPAGYRNKVIAPFAPGPALGRTLSALLDAVTDGRVVNEKAALLDYALSAAATDIQ